MKNKRLIVFYNWYHLSCTILERKNNSYVVSTLNPWDTESEKELYKFEISKDLIINI